MADHGLGSNFYECIGGPCDGATYGVVDGVRFVKIALPASMAPHDMGYTHTRAYTPQLRAATYEVRPHPSAGRALYWLPTG